MLKRALSTIALALCGAAVSIAPADAVPTFAKAYGIQCSVCHTIPPQLNAYGRYIQRTGYSALSRDLVKDHTPLTLSEEPSSDTSTGSGRVEFGNTALHAAGYLSPDVTFHLHQWIVQNGGAGDVDTAQVVYNKLLKENGHLFVGKLSALPVPGPFSNQTDLAPYQTSELQVGEHMYQLDMMRWGYAFSYVRPKLFAQVAYFGGNGGWNQAFDFSADTDKTFQWVAAYADSGKPWEIGTYGQSGSFPLAEGGVDHYNTFGAYAQRDPGPKFTPGLLALYQWGYDANPGMMMTTGMPAAGPANSQGLTLEAWEPVINNRAIVALRYEYTNDGLGTFNHSGNIDFDMRLFNHYDYLHLYLESGLQQNAGPTWRTMLWWAVPLGR